ncbi:uncharacterized protein [Primulina huaijiensis]|uniref:uncharacterized protein isoform X2 n=1 Tax=Primulina huaijiensis TaxID=1492673 RepID=UPI003CC71DA9
MGKNERTCSTPFSMHALYLQARHLIPLQLPQNLSIRFLFVRRREDPAIPLLAICSPLLDQFGKFSGGKSGKMNRLVYQQKALVGGCVTDGVICPKPRRIGGLPLHFHDTIKTHSWLLQIKNSPTDVYDAKAGTVLLDIIQSKVASSPPFFTGSPPSRASNPVILDEQFRNDDAHPLSPALTSGGCAQGSFDSKPAPVRIEGFNCRESFSISAVA